MVEYRRNFVPGGQFFFTVALEDRRAAWLTLHVELLRAAIARTQRALPFRIDAMVVLPEHLHSIFTLPAGDADFHERWRRIKGGFTRAVREAGVVVPGRENRGFQLWQRRYWEHTVRDEADYRLHVDYIHYNPVKHGYVANAVDWPFSSLHRFIRAGVLPDAWGSDGAAEGDFGEPRSPR